VRDNLGNVWVPGNSANITGDRLCVGDTLEFVVSATDPLGEPLSYRLYRVYGADPIQWQEDNVLRKDITADDVRRDFKVIVYIRSPRPYHARGTWDDDVLFQYEVLPPMSDG
jgi:hypothetical protein